MLGDIIIIGGGASGLAAAVSAKLAVPSTDVVVCERLDRVGKKILSTGNGRCNLSNRSISPENYHGSVDAAAFIGAAPPAEDFFADMGVLVTSDEAGRIYPHSNAASTVLNALRMKLSSLGVREECGFEVRGIANVKGGYTVVSADGRRLSARRIIAAAGGYAAPSAGTDGSLMRLFRDKGYSTAKVFPAVAPLRVDPGDVKGLKGIRAKCRITAYSGEKKLRSEAGEIQFTENSLSGICVFNMAYLFGQYGPALTISADLAPDMGSRELTSYLRGIAGQRSGEKLEELLTGMFQKNLAVYLVKRAFRRPLTDNISALGKDSSEVLTGLIKDCRFSITGAAPWQSAQSTLGGISASEITPQLASKRDKGIYFCGEILDTAGDCGGYNLQWAWSSGYIAGKNCALSLKG